MADFFLVCAGIGTLVLVIQMIVGALGHHAGTDHDVSHDDGGLFFGILSIRAISAAVAAFGITGKGAYAANLGETRALMLAVLAGLGMMGIVAMLLRSMKRLNASGTVDSSRAVDQIATVYVAVPGNYAGQGKVQVDVQNRTVELAAVTHGPALSTGTRVRIVQIVSGATAEVVSAGIG